MTLVEFKIVTLTDEERTVYINPEYIVCISEGAGETTYITMAAQFDVSSVVEPCADNLVYTIKQNLKDVIEHIQQAYN